MKNSQQGVVADMNLQKQYKKETGKEASISNFKFEYVQWLENKINRKSTEFCPECHDGMTYGNFCSNCGRELPN